MGRFGLGPVFVYEWLTGARRWQMYAIRAGFVLLLLVSVTVVWVNKAHQFQSIRVDLRTHAAIGEVLFAGFFGMLISLVLLAAPAATAGAVCLDKSRGNLLHLFATDLSNAEVVFGKLASRLLPVAGLLLASVPMLSVCLLMGGIDADAMYTGYAVCAALAVFGCALALALSVWGRKTHEVLLAAYLVELLLLLAYPFAAGIQSGLGFGRATDSLAWTNPFLLTFSRYQVFRTKTDGTDLALFLCVTLAAAAVLTLAAAATVRRATTRQSGEARATRRGWKQSAWLDAIGPQLDWNPVLWREWHRTRPRAWVVVVWGVYFAGCAAGTLSVAWLAAFKGSRGEIAPFTAAFQVSIGLLLASVSSVTALSEERVRGSLDVLLTTRLTTPQIVFGKWLGAYRTVPPLAVFPVLTALAQAAFSGHPGRLLAVPIMGLYVCAVGAAVTSLGLALATWIARPSRAIAVGVVVYLAVTVGWLTFIMSMARHDIGRALAAASPFFGPGQLAFEAGVRGGREWEGFSAVPVWSAVYFVVAGVLYALVLTTFDRCLGRVSGRFAPVRPLGALAAPRRATDRQPDPV